MGTDPSYVGDISALTPNACLIGTKNRQVPL